MPPITPITDAYAVTGQLSASQFAEVAASGFRSIINFRPDGEVAGQLAADDAADLARASGLRYAALPATKFDLFSDVLVSGAATALADLPAPVLAYCASGQRAAVVWAAVTARSRPVDSVLDTLRTAGFKLDFLRDDLEMQADRARWQLAEAQDRPADAMVGALAAA